MQNSFSARRWPWKVEEVATCSKATVSVAKPCARRSPNLGVLLERAGGCYVTVDAEQVQHAGLPPDDRL